MWLRFTYNAPVSEVNWQENKKTTPFLQQHTAKLSRISTTHHWKPKETKHTSGYFSEDHHAPANYKSNCKSLQKVKLWKYVNDFIKNLSESIIQYLRYIVVEKVCLSHYRKLNVSQNINQRYIQIIKHCAPQWNQNFFYFNACSLSCNLKQIYVVLKI